MQNLTFPHHLHYHPGHTTTIFLPRLLQGTVSSPVTLLLCPSLHSVGNTLLSQRKSNHAILCTILQWLPTSPWVKAKLQHNQQSLTELAWTPILMLGGVSHTLKQSLDTSWASYSSTQLWHYLPGDSIRFHRLRVRSYKLPTAPHKLQTSIPSLGCYLCFWLAADWRLPQARPWTSDASHKSRLSPVPLINWLKIRGSHDFFPGFD